MPIPQPIYFEVQGTKMEIIQPTRLNNNSLVFTLQLKSGSHFPDGFDSIDVQFRSIFDNNWRKV